eukprot:gnl/Dysnectes_brevis/1145_a1279_4518.p1 GENE.gnl/Dysnectes_brevis/1145_a1279_4518~~gnl/Dysnectes_brevis/1145_a1279_4518.p1  ORF type:complete len:182 (-),score=44.09 gnl/Dysnectes_brevis/1145_a1279_4518:55-600(-)
MSTPARRRILRDFKNFIRDPPDGVMASPYKDNMMHWAAVILGPEDTVWEGATLRLDIMFSEDYPSKPPNVKFLSKVFHPNVYTSGAICLDLLQNRWSAAYNIGSILTSIQSLLTDPNPASPANAEAANLFVSDRHQYEQRVRESVKQSWEDLSGPHAAMLDSTEAEESSSYTDEDSKEESY